MAELRARVHLDLADQARLSDLRPPGEDLDSVVTRLVLVALDGRAWAAGTRDRIEEQAVAYAGALAASAEPVAAAWAEALAWFADRIREGRAGQAQGGLWIGSVWTPTDKLQVNDVVGGGGFQAARVVGLRLGW